MTSIADHYRTLAGNFSDTVDAVPPDRWDDASPCEEWSAREVVQHVVDTEIGMLERVGLTADPPPAGDAPSARWSAVRDLVQDALDDPERAEREYDGLFGRTTFEKTIDTFGCFDLLVHRWDLARATGLTSHEAMPTEELTRAFEMGRSLGDNLRQPGVCGPAVEIADDADEQSRLLAFLGRQP